MAGPLVPATSGCETFDIAGSGSVDIRSAMQMSASMIGPYHYVTALYNSCSTWNSATNNKVYRGYAGHHVSGKPATVYGIKGLVSAKVPILCPGSNSVPSTSSAWLNVTTDESATLPGSGSAAKRWAQCGWIRARGSAYDGAVPSSNGGPPVANYLYLEVQGDSAAHPANYRMKVFHQPNPADSYYYDMQYDQANGK